MNTPHVLIVEDEAVTALMLEQMLRKQGYSIAGVEQAGETAVDTANREHPDVILMDIRLKGEMDGIAAAAALAGRSPIIFMSAFTDRPTIERAEALHPLAILEKPLNLDDLTRLLARIGRS
jgi:CheY-like chemotaxis protein